MSLFESMESRQLQSAVTGVTLINAQTGHSIEPLVGGTAIDLSASPNLNVVANTTGSVARIKFNLDGVVTNAYRSPFAMEGYSHGKYATWAPSDGDHVLRIYAWDSHGHQLKGKTVDFTVTDGVSSAPPPTNPTPPPTNPLPPPTNPVPPPSQPTDPAPPGTPEPPIPGNWNMTFDDEFNESSVNTKNFVYRYWWDGDLGDSGEEEVYQPSAVSISNGSLQLTATKQSAQGTDGNTYPYTSGLVTTGGIEGVTNPGYSFQYGYVEASIKIPAGQGLWPAFWMLPTSHNDGDGEIDIMEAIGSEITTDQEHYHVNGTTYGHATDTGVDLSAGYHTYGVDWEKGSITWYLDGKEVFQYTGSNVVAEPEYLILNLAVGGDWPGPPNSSTVFPASMDVDYVRVWQQAA